MNYTRDQQHARVVYRGKQQQCAVQATNRTRDACLVHLLSHLPSTVSLMQQFALRLVQMGERGRDSFTAVDRVDQLTPIMIRGQIQVG